MHLRLIILYSYPYVLNPLGSLLISTIEAMNVPDLVAELYP